VVLAGDDVSFLCSKAIDGGNVQRSSSQGCYTTKCDMVEDGLTECASEGNPGRLRLTRCYHVTRVISGEMGNLVMKVDMKENMEEGSMMANTELLEAWISSSKANSVSDKANQVTWVS
jgi:hypothetical protein